MHTALLLSGGTGTRLGGSLPKQYREVCGKPMISYCLRQLSLHEKIDAIQIVASPSWQEPLLEWLKEADPERKFRGFSLPGENRQLSILHGMEDIRHYAPDDSLLFIHDAARPLLSRKQITDCLDAAPGYDGVLPVLPMKDTVYSSKDGKTISALLNRSQIYAGQAPEVFTLGPYYRASLRLLPEKILEINGSTEPAILAGLNIAMIPGDENNFKVTTAADLARFQKIIADAAQES